jgi:hypothetical protein
MLHRVSEVVLRRIVKLKQDLMIGDWRKVYSEQLHTLYSSPYIIRMIKPRHMRWAEHVACIITRDVHTKFSGII